MNWERLCRTLGFTVENKKDFSLGYEIFSDNSWGESVLHQELRIRSYRGVVSQLHFPDTKSKKSRKYGINTIMMIKTIIDFGCLP